MRVLVLGASGFIGLPIAQAFVRAGHIVYGLTRSQQKAKQLAAEEIIPVIGETSNPSAWLTMVATLDVIIDAAAQKYRPAHAPKLTYIYTSGTWVHGENRKDIQEQRVIRNPVLNGIVIRPALLYGRSGSLLAPLYALIHCDDLAEMYLLASEKSAIAAGQIFDAANDFTENADDVLHKLLEVSGAKGPFEYIEPSNCESVRTVLLYEIALSTTSLLRPYLARSLLGWQP
ncbi:uncharacterized protein B0H18DRAFT_972728 [Fomitopsis serialis]|uniref:uncharacterized protein n=1 Tax=Fomitopsis serialis TaxID=139415 RepID=UPI00200843A5|nr:uncharacterized protein B0H18DRAFT_972728 [Neoantrodia serialis]KAH9936189.1 hypothetical protein B0H18DRAFT_972728 [Neoantrodia serialis]